MSTATPEPALRRSLGTGDAVLIGLGSMIGAGIFAAFAPAAAAAGTGLLLGLCITGIVAFCNAACSAQLAARYPSSGGTYLYGRKRLGPWPGFLAGWGFLIGKTASCAAMALVFSAYVAPPGWDKPVALAAVVVLAGVNCFGVTRTAAMNRVIVVFVLLVLGLVLAAGLVAVNSGRGAVPQLESPGPGVHGILQSAGLLFFAFAGYARIATLGEEVRNPRRTIPRAIMIALGVTLLLYALVAVVLLTVLGPAVLASSTEPLVRLVVAGGWGWAGPIVRIGAAAAVLGALLALFAGIGRTALAMGRHDDLPRFLARVDPKYRVPRNAEILVAVVVCFLVSAVDLRGAIGFSSFGVLVYCVIANVSALTQPVGERIYPRIVAVLGAIGCLTLVATLPRPSIAAGIVVLVVGVVYRLIQLCALAGKPS
ncbi:APC family permease [Paeniglutamicibacter cryotolerans]|uniref:APA family basic amino acid/polyamine antiporter n=1 Tax=Paeniglutamicibacter cryotolerans TaxID=670079 RepID=A0A839QLQ0_9MICC|nr:APC family permease [Paeniglutamicibacter cryotolerans]MBB2996777.1 APA family basic amino acid/polyamine antiporter [Paeniglutamicibacter cryotolerans]